jgi:hypothetical protein
MMDGHRSSEEPAASKERSSGGAGSGPPTATRSERRTGRPERLGVAHYDHWAGLRTSLRKRGIAGNGGVPLWLIGLTSSEPTSGAPRPRKVHKHSPIHVCHGTSTRW